MKTIRELRKRLTPGTVLTTRHYRKDEAGVFQLTRTCPGRVVLESDSHAFKMRTETNVYPYYDTDWIHWPMTEYFRPVDDHSVAIETEQAKIEIIITGNIILQQQQTRITPGLSFNTGML